MNTEHCVRRADRADIPAIAALFTESFADSVLHHCGRFPRPQAMQDVFSLVLEAEPAAALVVGDDCGGLKGYCFAPTRLPNLWLRALAGGHVFRWAWRWLTGQYGFGLHPVKVIVMNKLAFLRSAVSPTKAANARILSVAVAPRWRGRGVANALMDEALAYFRARKAVRARLEVRPDNFAAIRVYERCGFVSAGYTYDSQGAWLIMMKEMAAD